MPSKIQLEENLWFLFICLQKSDYKTIDFNAVGQATNLKSPAARMRYTRLRRQIEGGTLIGTHGTPFSGAVDRTAHSLGKGKGKCKPNEDKAINGVIKCEYEECSDDSETDTSGGFDSEDEMPLAKRKLAKSVDRDMTSSDLAANTPYAAPMSQAQDNGFPHITFKPNFFEKSSIRHTTVAPQHLQIANPQGRLSNQPYEQFSEKPLQTISFELGNNIASMLARRDLSPRRHVFYRPRSLTDGSSHNSSAEIGSKVDGDSYRNTYDIKSEDTGTLD